MKITLPEFEKARVLVVGDVMLDRYWHGPTTGSRPRHRCPWSRSNTLRSARGAANVALNSAALGAHAVLLGLTGQDEAADALAGQMAGVKVACDFVRLADYPTITKLRVLSRNQQLLRLDFEEAFHDVDSTLLMGKVEQALPHSDVMILSDYGKGASTTCPA